MKRIASMQITFYILVMLAALFGCEQMLEGEDNLDELTDETSTGQEDDDQEFEEAILEGSVSVNLNAPAFEDAKVRSLTSPGAGEIWLYTSTNFGGSKMVMSHNDYSGLLFTWSNNFESLKVGPDTVANLFTNTNYTGVSRSFTEGDYSNLSTYGLSNNVSSVQTRPGFGFVWLYDGYDWTGNVLRVPGDYSSLSSSMDNKAKSIKVGWLTNAILYKYSGYSGTYYNATDHNGNIYSLSTSSVRIIPAEGWAWFYEHSNYGGEMIPLSLSANNLAIFSRGSGDWNQAISSFKVGVNTEVTLYDYTNWGGWSYRTSSNHSSLSSSYNDDTTSVEVRFKTIH